MENKNLLGSLRNFISKIKNHPAQALIGSIFLIAFLIFSYNHPLNTHSVSSSHATLPSTTQPAGTFTLITEPDQGISPVLDLIKNSTPYIDNFNSQNIKYIELDFFNPSPKYAPDYFINLPKLYKTWQKDMGLEGKEIPAGIRI